MKSIRYFNIGMWTIETANIASSYRALEGLLSNEDILKHYVNNLPIFTYCFDPPDTISIEPDADILQTQGLALLLQRGEQEYHDLLRAAHLKAVIDAHNVYRRQMIVLVATYIESILIDFIECMFTAHPHRMHEYLTDTDEGLLKGKVDLKEILNSDSIETLTKQLANRAAAIATRGKFRTALNNLENLTKCKLEPRLKEDLLALIELRNRIVHEASLDIITCPQLEKGFDHITAFLAALGNIAISSHIPVSDPGELVVHEVRP